jgi:hypothetical protein
LRFEVKGVEKISRKAHVTCTPGESLFTIFSVASTASFTINQLDRNIREQHNIQLIPLFLLRATFPES